MPNVPPVVVAGAAALTQVVLARRSETTATSKTVGAVVVGASGILGASAVWSFRNQDTTVDPMDVDKAQSLVVAGPFRFTRNPMYVAIAGALLAHAITKKSVAAVVPVAGFVAAMNRMQIPREEAAMRRNFGANYAEYVRRVPRWLV